MKYRVDNQLELFGFHDSIFSLVSFDEKSLVVSAKHLNIHIDAKANPYNCDMEIDTAMISFQDVHILSLEPMRAQQLDDEGNWCTDEPQVILTDKDAQEKFVSELEDGVNVYYVDIRQSGERTTIEIGISCYDSYIAVLLFSNVRVEWDAYHKKAWYELHEDYQYEITLLTRHGEEKNISACFM